MTLQFDPSKNNVSWFAHYNLPITDIDPLKLNNSSNGGTMTCYDNGVEFNYSDSLVGRDFTIRAAPSGWITAHMDYIGGNFTQDTQNKKDMSSYYSTSNRSSLNGDYDLIGWTEPGNVYKTNENRLFLAIKDSLKELDKWSQFEYEPNDIKIYNYQYDSNVNVTIFGSSEYISSFNKNEKENSVVYSDTTTVLKSYIVCSLQKTDRYNSSNLYIKDSNDNRVNAGGVSSSGTKYIAIDYTELLNETQNIDTVLSIDNTAHGMNSSGSVYAMVIWV